MTYRVKNWRRFQHYKDRNPPWIKLHFELLSSADWVTLDDASRVLAIACMLIASRNDGEIDATQAGLAYLKRVAYLNKPPNLKPLIECGFLESASGCKQMLATARPEEETEEETDILPATPATDVSRETAPEWMLDFKLAYPDRDGGQNWRGAQKAGRARLREGHSPEELIDGAKRYAAWVTAKGKRGTEYVKTAAAFLGPGKHFLEPWAIVGSSNGKDPYANAI